MSDIITQREYFNATYIFAAAFVDELQRSGVHHVVICPGSRSTPLAMTFASQPQIQTWMHVDERSAAFFALGMAKQLDEPVALVCTSGTAAANFYPAIVEARLTHIPLLVLTADRPHELREVGAPQAINQNQLYGNHVKWFAEVALPEATNEALRYIRTLADRATMLTQAIPAGPVHLNMPFREPLTPDPLSGQTLPIEEQRDNLAWYGRPDNVPYITINKPALASLNAVQVAHLAQRMDTAERGLIVVGPHAKATLIGPVIKLAQRLGYPLLADPLSQVRCNDIDDHQSISSYDAFLRIDHVIERLEPQLVLRFGAMPTSKPLLLYLKRYPHCEQIIVNEQGSWEEPTQLASEMVHANPVALCADLMHALGDAATITEQQQSWLQSWLQADQVTRQTLHSAIHDFQSPFEGRIFLELSELLPAGATLFTSNSMPVRDLDTFFWHQQRPLRILGNRGANGIDGIVSSALGVSAANGQQAPTVLVIGDLSFFHDLNGLLAAHLHQLNMVIVLVNNDGGGIFSFLPQAQHQEHFELLFGTPTGLRFRPVVEMYGGTFTTITSWEHFRTTVQQGLDNGGLHVVEVGTERNSNVVMHRQLWQQVSNALKELKI